MLRTSSWGDPSGHTCRGRLVTTLAPVCPTVANVYVKGSTELFYLQRAESCCSHFPLREAEARSRWALGGTRHTWDGDSGVTPVTSSSFTSILVLGCRTPSWRQVQGSRCADPTWPAPAQGLGRLCPLIPGPLHSAPRVTMALAAVDTEPLGLKVARSDKPSHTPKGMSHLTPWPLLVMRGPVHHPDFSAHADHTRPHRDPASPRGARVL